MYENLRYELQAHFELLAEQSIFATTRKKSESICKELPAQP